jgi:hypothetical protein
MSAALGKVMSDEIWRLEGELACCCDLLNTWARETGASECHEYTKPLALRNHIDNLWGRVSEKHYKQVAKRDEQLAAIADLASQYNHAGVQPDLHAAMNRVLELATGERREYR